MAQHADFTVASGVPVYFCDPRSPWQRGSNEDTNGLLRQYLPRKSRLGDRTQLEAGIRRWWATLREARTRVVQVTKVIGSC